MAGPTYLRERHSIKSVSVWKSADTFAFEKAAVGFSLPYGSLRRVVRTMLRSSVCDVIEVLCPRLDGVMRDPTLRRKGLTNSVELV
jgi:hypothetical protein